MLDISEITHFQQKKSFCLTITTLDRNIAVHHFESWAQCAIGPSVRGWRATTDSSTTMFSLIWSVKTFSIHGYSWDTSIIYLYNNQSRLNKYLMMLNFKLHFLHMKIETMSNSSAPVASLKKDHFHYGPFGINQWLQKLVRLASNFSNFVLIQIL